MADPHISDPPLEPPLRISVVIPQTMGPPPRPTDNQHTPQRRSSRTRFPSRLTRTSSQDPEAPARSQHSSSRTTSSSSHKRKRSEVSLSRSSSLLSLGTDFSGSTKRKIENAYGEDGGCWHCGLKGTTETAHVLGASKKEVFYELHNLGLLNIERLGHEDNAIRLCVLCHRNLDFPEPSWAFIPEDLEFFIQSENEDRIRRVEEFRSTHSLPKRQCPSTSQYRDHGGLYRSYMRRNFHLQDVAHEAEFSPGPSRLQPDATRWHGDPMVTLQRAFSMVAMLPRVFPVHVKHALLVLSELYDSNDEVPSLQKDVRTSINDERSQTSDGSNDTNDDKRKKSDKTRTSHTQKSPQSNLQRQTEKSSTTEKAPPNSSSHRRQSSRIQDQVNLQATLKRRRAQDEARRLLEDPPHKKLRREILDGTWKWGPLSSSHMAALAFRRNRRREKRELDRPSSYGKNGTTGKAKLTSRLERGLLSPETS